MTKTLAILAAALLSFPLAASAASELSVTLNGGGTKYDQALSAGTDVGAEYGVRIGIIPTPIIGFEIGYLGSQNNVNATLNSNGTNQRLITNGAYGDLRANLLAGPVTPYIFGGFGVTNFKISNEVIDNNAGLHGRTVATVPFGAGLEANIGNFKVGGRFQYNYLLTDQLFRTNNNGNVGTGNNTDFYGVELDLGASFH